LDWILELMKITIFMIVNLLIGLGSLMICTHDLTILNETKETTSYCESFGYGGTTLSINISIVLTEVVYMQKMDKSSPSWPFHIIPVVWAFHFVPIMGVSHQRPTAKHKQSNKPKRKHTQVLIAVQKPQTTN
jgi:hypothetical protein